MRLCVAGMVLLGACVGRSACSVDETPLAPQQPVLVVHAVLDAGSQDQLILIERALGSGTASPSSFNFPAAPVLGATVTITAPDGQTLSAVEDRLVDSVGAILGQYRVSLSRFGEAPLVPGGTYALHVHTLQGEDVLGTTTVPPAVATTSSATASFSARSDTLRLTWIQAQGVNSYEVRIVPSASDAYAFFSDSSVALAGTTRNGVDIAVFVAGLRTTAIVSAVDANYYEYYRTASDPFTGAPESRLTGAIGLFGAVVPVLVEILNVR